MTAPLDGIRVLDFSELLPGPFLTQTLVEFGAVVLKVERPGGDPTRNSPGLFHAVNRGKRGIVLDLKSTEGKAKARQLAEDCDVVVEGFRPGVMSRLGLGFDDLVAVNPRLVYISMSGYGRDGPMAHVSGHDINYLAQAGVISVSGAVGAPYAHVFGLPIADLSGASYGLSAILAALFQRERTGRGQHLDLALSDCIAHWTNVRRGPFQHSGITDPEQQRSKALLRPAYGVFQCADGAVSIAALETHFWQALVKTLDLSDFADEAYANSARRYAEAAVINAAIAEAVADELRYELLPRLNAADIPAAAVLTLDESIASEHMRARAHVAPESSGMVRFPVVLAGVCPQPQVVPPLGRGEDDRSFAWPARPETKYSRSGRSAPEMEADDDDQTAD